MNFKYSARHEKRYTFIIFYKDISYQPTQDYLNYLFLSFKELI